jgi:PAS domain S-box-containing protein
MLVCAAALLVLWAFRRSVLDQWLMVVVLASMVELAIRFHPIAAGSRITVGFYAGRLLFSLVTSTFVLTALIAETTRLYAGVARANMLASIVKASQVLSSEIMLPNMIDRLMKIAIVNAGADRGLLILRSGDEFQAEAEARTNGDQIDVTQCREPITPIVCPESLVHHVIHTREYYVLDDTSRPSQFANDDYLRDRKSKSILCLPLVKQQELAGILLLENTSISHAFTPARIAVLELLAAQAAISLENTRLYHELKEREANIRRLVDSNIIGIIIWRPDGRVVDANEAFLRLVSYTRDDLLSGRVRWTDLTPPEWRERSEQALAEIKETGAFQPYEKVYLRKDGSRVPVLIGGAIFDSKGTEGVAFVLDLSDRKRAEEALRRAQADLAHVSRVTTLGEMTASIAHEVNQPLGSVVNNANACLSILPGGTRQLEEVREALVEIIEGADRASSVISRVRQLSKKVPYERTLVSLKDVVRDVFDIAQSEAARREVIISTDLTDGLPFVSGDRVQLQQVLLNLVVNGMDALSKVEASNRTMIISARSVTQGEKPEVLVSVQDAGTGFKPEEQERLFEPFYSTKPDGMGMGLAISRTIVEAHGGRLWAEANQGTGATFLLSLPIASRDEL